jgi:hypothetical protein
MNKIYAILLTVLAVSVSAGTAEASQKVWTGASSALWNDAANWQPSGVPGSGDNVVFDGTVSSAPCNLPLLSVVSNLHIKADYTGTITGFPSSGALFTVQQTALIEGGTFNLGNSRLKSMQMLRLTGGEIIKGNSGIMTMIALTIEGGSLTIGTAQTEVLGNLTMNGGSLISGNGSFTVSQLFNLNGGVFSKTGGLATFQQVVINGGTLNGTSGALDFASLRVTGGSVEGSGSLFMRGNLELTSGGSLNKTAGSIYMSAGADIISAGTFSAGAASLQAGNITISGGSFDFGSGNTLVNGTLNAENAIVSKSTGQANVSLDNQVSFNNCTITWGNDVLNTGNLSLVNSTMQLGSGVFQVDGGFVQQGNSIFTKSGGYAGIADNSDLSLEGGNMDFSACTELVTNNFRQIGGEVIHGNIPVKIRGRLILSGDGIYNASSGTTFLSGDFRRSGGTFNHNGGLVDMNGASSLTYRILGGPAFNSLKLSHTEGANAKTIEIYGSITVLNELIYDNGSSTNRNIVINNGSIWLYGNLNIGQYRSEIIQPGSGSIRFSSSGYQTVTGMSAIEGQGILPLVRVEKPGGTFFMSGSLSFGNGFSFQNADIQFDPEFVFCMAGGEFMLENLFIPSVKVIGAATLSSNLICMGNLNITSGGLLINSDQPISVNGSFNNAGRFRNMNGLINVTGSLVNSGEFSTNTGSVNALSGISQQAGSFSGNAGQVNVLGILTLNNGVFSCNDGLVQISGSFIQNDGILRGNLNTGSMTVSQNFTQNGGTYEAQNGTLNIGGILSINGQFLRGNGNVNFNGIGPQRIPALYYNRLSIAGTGRLITLPQAEIKIGAAVAGFAPNPTNAYISTNNTINYCSAGDQEIAGFVYHNLTVSRTGTKYLTGNASVKQVLDVKNSAVLDADGLANNRLLTLLSTQNLTARIAPITGNGSITGNVSVQRWTRGGIRSNRFFASPVDTSGGVRIRQFRDDILIYGPGGIANGFDDPTVFNQSIYVYDEPRANGTEWRSPNTVNETVPVGKGVLVYYLGNRSQAPLQNITVPNPATIDFIGTPNQGTIQLPMECTAPCILTDNGNGWNLVANPYASPIDWDSPEWTKSDVSSTIFIWNPRINQYSSYNSANPAAATNGGSRFIGPGQSFFMKATGNTPALIANERIKTASFPDTLLFRIAAPQNQLRLVLNNTENESRDEVIVAFDDRSTDSFDPQFDVLKPRLPMMISNLALRNEQGDLLGVHTFPSPLQGDEIKRIPLSLDAQAGTYTLSASQLESFASGVEFYLENTLTGEIQLLREGEEYPVIISEGNEEKLSNAFVLRIGSSFNSNSPAVSGLRAFPNPSNGEQVKFWTSDQSQGVLEVFDAMGRRIASELIQPGSGTFSSNVFDKVSSGMYTVSFTTESSKSSTRLTIN